MSKTLTHYEIETMKETRATCIRSVERLEEEIKTLTDNYTRTKASLRDRIIYCRTKISEIIRALGE